ncbi:MAG: PHP domain-containing protein [Deltaproteobacteria bacterium]|nr:PHP domain-containing protein [Deltaproteobacteria bacterium]
MLKIFNCDLHVHSCLSPCAELDMHPMALVKKAIEAKLDMIAICDHNSSANVPYVIKAAQMSKLKILPGMEITTNEEVHILAIFDSLSNLTLMQNIIDQHLPGENDESRFGVQAIVNERGEVEGINNQLLIGATDLPLNELIGYIHQFDGLAIAAHIDRESFSVLSQLGFIDDNADFDALEITPLTGFTQARIRYQELSKYSFIVSSDSHFIKDIGQAFTRMSLQETSFAELKMALKKQNGRFVMEQPRV